MTMITTIQQAVRPFFIVCFIIGLGVYPLKESRPKIKWIIYLSILYSLMIWFIYCYFVYYIIRSFSLISIYRTNIMVIVMEINTIIAITSVILNIYHYKRFQIFMKRLTAVDDTLEELGTSKIYKKIHKWSKRTVIVWIIFSVAANFYDTLWWINREEMSAWIYILPYIGNYCLHANGFVDLIFITFLWYINNRFDKINEHIQYLSMKEEHGLNKWKKPVINVYRNISRTNNYKRVLWSLMHLHLELCRIARELNGMFGIQMAFEMASHLFFLTSMYHYVYGMLTQKIQEEARMTAWLGNIFWTLVFILRLCIINYLCENISVKGNEIRKIIYQLTSALRYANIRKEIYQFALQIMHNPLRFTGMGLFYFGNNFLRKRFEICVIRLAAVDDTLEELGTAKMYRKIHILGKGILIGWIVYSLAINFDDTIYWLSRKEFASWGLFLSHILNYPIHVNTFLDLLFIFLLWYISTRFDKVNEHVRCLLVKEEHGLRCTWKKSVVALRRDTTCIDNCKRTLWTTMQLHLELCRLTRELNSIFGTQMALEMASYLVFLTALCYYVCTILIQGRQKEIKVWFNIILWTFIFLMKLCVVNYICESVTDKANEINKTIHQLTNSIRYADVWKEIYQFTLQIMYRPLKLTGMGLFYLGDDFLRKFFTTIVNFLIIMVQLKIIVDTS
ncbi:uncharacterized protein [Polyergus mexicanus]|uniref:uncharacterized protein n=1 Tax=Polyergus mexicanus TaxID=615972 RepID=UPI0038B6AF0C